jgi:exonuclease V gamma subunit
VCNIELPERANLLKGIETFTIEKGLGEWSLLDLILNDESDYKQKIEIQKIRGDLPSGKFINKHIESIEKTVEELRERAKDENPGTFWIYPSLDKGKYRLKHWLKHLDLNMNKNQDTKIFLKDNTITLAGMPKEKANEILEDLWKLKQELEKRMLPIFPNAAYVYLKTEKEKIREAEKVLFKEAGYSEYTKMLFGDAKSLKDLGIENEFIECSERLFSNFPTHHP